MKRLSDSLEVASHYQGALPGEAIQISRETRIRGAEISRSLKTMLKESEQLKRINPEAAKRQLIAKAKHIAKVLAA